MKTRDFSEWLAAYPGRQQWLADRIGGVTRQAVAQWGASGVPIGRMNRVSDITRIPLTHLLKHAIERKAAE